MANECNLFFEAPPDFTCKLIGMGHIGGKKW